MDIPLFEKLHEEGYLDREALDRIRTENVFPIINVRGELKVLLYLGILLLTTGLGILVYKNINEIGHLSIVGFIALTCAGCFAYAFKKAAGFDYGSVQSPGVLFDYILLLGCLLMLTLVAYLQFEFSVFGTRWGLATFIPMVILFFSAYYFDHLGVLSLAIINLATWVGISITPMRLLENNNFSSDRITFTGILLGGTLLAAGFLSTAKKLKPHFSFTYRNFGIHLLYVSLIAAMAQAESLYPAWFFAIVLLAYFQYKDAVRERSFYFVLVSTLYSYIAMSYVILHGLSRLMGSDGILYLTLLYLIGSAIALVIFLIQQNKRLKHAGLS
ncbi:DUF2157 domain-containing protein [Segetibacter sp. 3557_3]|uniref:DUF2157 domain-containing protein n=1 Tax=Segetibacter sp. 3557_3 TaxID=2547429 RepID=UPI001058AC3C|nr:DUF2157 domain-containing protein [Segetibacter sp. 3557_3]TDH23046.1 DUF2157 domain-containing protein [Segetibacter sp. 3557_3]